MGIRLLNPINPVCKVSRATDQAISNTTSTALSFSDDAFGLNNGMWAIGDPTKVYCIFPGIYLLNGQLPFENNNFGGRQGWFSKNATGKNFGELSIMTRNDGGQLQMTMSGIVDLQPGDYVELFVFQNSGATVNIEADGVSLPMLSVALISALNVP